MSKFLFLRYRLLDLAKDTRKTYMVIVASLISSCCFYNVNGQTFDEQKDYYEWFDKKTGTEHSNLYEGTLSVEKYATLNGNHNFFGSRDYLNGHIVYNGETYFDIDMKYDLYEDEVLLPLRSDARVMMVKLIKERINEFVIDGHRFIKIINNGNENGTTYGFFEVIKENPFFIFLKKHKKARYPVYKKNMVLSKFVEEPEYYIDYGDTLYPIKKRKDIIKIFPQYKTALNKKSAKSKSKTAKDEYLVKLLDIVHNRMLLEKPL